MSGLAGRIAARLDALEAGARAATPGDWKLWGMQVLADQDGTSNADTAVPVASTHFRNEAGKPRTFDADHIAAWDPAAVLRMVEGLRDLVALIESERHEVVEDCWYTCGAATDERDGGECCDDRRGPECDCGRDVRVERRLGLLAAALGVEP